jgi:ATP-dependent Zn protease
LLTTNRAALDKVAAALLEHETLSGEEIKLLVQVGVLCCLSGPVDR